MKLFIATYYDHIDRGGYRPEIVVENWRADKRLIFCAPSQAERLKDVDAEVVVIDKTIRDDSRGVRDIPIAQNTGMEWCWEHGADVVCWVQGDVYITPKGMDYLGNITTQFGLWYVMGVVLYAEKWRHYPIVVSNKDWKCVYLTDADGAANNLGTRLVEDDSLALSMDYLGLPQYRAKMENHNYFWADQYKKEWLKVYSTDKVRAVRMAYRNLKKSKGAMLTRCNESLYAPLLDKLNLWDDYKFCTEILKGI